MKVNDSIPQDELLSLINQLAKKKRTLGLNEEETQTQKSAYQVYLKRIRAQFDGQLDNVKIKTPDGKLTPFKDYATKKNKNHN